LCVLSVAECKGSLRRDLARFASGKLVWDSLGFLESGDRYKIDYSGVAVKSRCVAEIVNIACNINTL
jgi:hypothetical protein